MTELARDLLAFLDASPTPYHAAAESAERLEAAGYRRLREHDAWDLAPGDRAYVLRGGGSLVAFEMGSGEVATSGLRILGAHTDSPSLRVKPRPDVKAHGYRQLAVEPYGSALLYTWLDRDLGLAGRVSVAAQEEVRTVLVDVRRPIARIPSLAIHLNRELRTEGLKLNEQNHLAPIIGLETTDELATLLSAELADQAIETGLDTISPKDILAFDLMLYDLQGATFGGAADEFVLSGRLDNLGSSHAALSALIAAGDAGESEFTRIVTLYDHEEIGSRSAYGAQGTLLLDVVDRIASLTGVDPETRARALARSWFVSADMAHAVHPNYVDRYEPGHKPVIGGGPVIKINAGQSYANEAETTALIVSICRRYDIPHQHFVWRSDVGGGSTIGPITSARIGVRTIDVGNPMLAMHSCREMAGTADVEPMVRLLTHYLAGN